MASDPSATFSTETPAGMALVKSSDTHLPYSALPTGTSIYVRLDISRSYDATNHVALLNMKTYVGNTFPLADQPCGASDFQDLSQDMANVCPNYAPTLQQDSIAINRIAALSAASWASSTVTATAMAHGLANGAPVIISGVSPSAYNGSHTVTVVDANTFTYTLASNPGSYVSGGDIQPMANIYFGFTNARSGTGAGEDQSVTIDQLLLRGQ